MKLEIKNLVKSYGTNTALNGVSVEFNKGLCGILGPNGAGKSSFMNLIADNTVRTEGEILYNGEDIIKLGESFRSILGYMPQNQGMYDGMSAWNFLEYIAELKGVSHKVAREQIPEFLDLVGLRSVAHRPLRTYSGGMKQRILFSQTLLGDPKVLLLDEPTAGMDPQERMKISEYVKNIARERIVLWSTHIVSDIEDTADAILIMSHGKKLCYGTKEEIMEKTQTTSLMQGYLKLQEEANKEDK